MECIRGKTSAEIDVDRLAAGVAGYDDVLVDLGTGDGRYVLHVARTSPTWFALGVDACRDNLRKASRIAPPNALYVIANAHALPGELGGMASKVTINFPWGSLLKGLLYGKPVLLEGLLAISRPGAALEARLNAGALAEAGYTLESGAARIRQALHEGGFEVVGDLLRVHARELRQCPTTWAKRLAYGRDPRAVCLKAMLTADGEAKEPAGYADRLLQETLTVVKGPVYPSIRYNVHTYSADVDTGSGTVRITTARRVKRVRPSQYLVSQHLDGRQSSQEDHLT